MAISFPVGDAVSDEGWDGVLDCAAAHPMVPDGMSGWEIGTDKSAPSKAEGDYAKRETDALGLSPATTTFVFVTPRAWPKRAIWSASKRAGGHWRDVRVIAAGDLELWLRDAPVVELWLARHLGLAPATGLTDLEGWWREWSHATTPITTPGMLVSGRASEVASVLAWTSGTSNSLYVQADAPDEALAFLYASLSTHPGEAGAALLSKAVVAETEEAFRVAANWTRPHIIAASADIAAPLAGAAGRSGHRIYLAVNSKISVRGQRSLRLGRLDAAELERALTLGGYPPPEAKRVVWECGRSIPVLRRRNIARIPAWAEPGQGHHLISALICSAWSEHERPTKTFGGEPVVALRDRAVVSGFAHDEYGAVATIARRWASGDDPPLRQVDPIWKLTAPVDAWFLLSRYVEHEHFDRLRSTATDVFTTLDPKYELPSDKQWSASMYGKEPPFSEWLREGLAQTLAIIANYGKQLELCIGDGSNYVYALMRSLYSKMDTWQTWASIDDVLPSLAEAAPTALLAGLKRFATRSPDEVRRLLSDVDNGMMGECRHVGMLWALERIAWNPTYFQRSCALLARLDELDPGGRWGNRPRSSLMDILAWPEEPYTYANASQRLATIDHLLDLHSETAWLLLTAAVESFRTRTVRAPPHVGETRPDGWQPESQLAIREYCQGLLDRLLAASASGPISRTIDLIKHVDRLPSPEQTKLAQQIEQVAIRAQGHDRIEILHALDHFSDRLESGYVRTPPSTKFVEAVSRTALLLEEKDLFSQLGSWFSDTPPRTPGIPLTEHSARERAVAERRKALVAQLIRDAGLPKTMTTAAGVARRWDFGFAHAACTSPTEDADLRTGRVAWPSSEPGHIPQVPWGYAAGRYLAKGETWLVRWLDSCSFRAGAEEVCATFLLILPPTAATWKRVSSFGAEVEALYWSWWHGMPGAEEDAESVSHVMEKLCSANRAHTALRIVSLQRAAQLPATVLIRVADAVLEEAARRGTGRMSSMDSYYTEQLFKALDQCADVSDVDVVRLEWSFQNVLEHTDRGLREVYRHMAANPEWFVHFVSLIWKPKGEEAALISEQAKAQANQAYTLLSNWSSPLLAKRRAASTRLRLTLG